LSEPFAWLFVFLCFGTCPWLSGDKIIAANGSAYAHKCRDELYGGGKLWDYCSFYARVIISFFDYDSGRKI
jgi:hypothetical protein